MSSRNSVSFLILLSVVYLALGASKKTPRMDRKSKENHILKTETKPVVIPDIVKDATDTPPELNTEMSTDYTSEWEADTEYENITEMEATSEETAPLVTYGSTVAAGQDSEHVSKANKTRPGAKIHHHNKKNRGNPHQKHTNKKHHLHVKKRIVHKPRRPGLHHSKTPGVQGAIRDANRRREEFLAKHKKGRRAQELHLRQIALEEGKRERSQAHKSRVKQAARRAQSQARDARKKVEADRRKAQTQAKKVIEKIAAQKQAQLQTRKTHIKQAARKAHPCTRRGLGFRCENVRQGPRPLFVTSRGLRKVGIDSRKLARDVKSLVNKPKPHHKADTRLRKRGAHAAKTSHRFKQARE